jgi:hypothetical protein
MQPNIQRKAFVLLPAVLKCSLYLCLCPETPPLTTCMHVLCRLLLLLCLCGAAHLLAVRDPATGKPLLPNQLKAEIAIFMAAGMD